MVQSPVRSTERPVEGTSPVARAGEPDPGPRLLVVDDDASPDADYAGALAGGGYGVLRPRALPGEMLTALTGQRVSLVILGLGLAHIDSVELCRRLSEHGIPVIALSASGTMAERVAAFEAGVDDYIVRPVSTVDLLCRVRAVLRRVLGPASATVLRGPAGVTLDARSREVRVHDVQVELSPREFELLRLLLEHRRQVMTPDTIAAQLWGYQTLGERNFVESHISRLRKKLRAAGAAEVISTARGAGYVVR